MIASIPARTATVAALCAAALLGARAAAAQDTRSAVAARQLAQALDAAKLDSIAAPDPTDPSTFVAALYFPGTQLLVVSAKYAAPTLLTEKLAARNYRDIYIDLNSASIAGSKIFVIDQSCNGLVARPEDNQVADSYEHGSSSLAFDGDWRKAKVSEAEYMKSFSAADERYARILSLLTAQVKGGV